MLLLYLLLLLLLLLLVSLIVCSRFTGTLGEGTIQTQGDDTGPADSTYTNRAIIGHRRLQRCIRLHHTRRRPCHHHPWPLQVCHRNPQRLLAAGWTPCPRRCCVRELHHAVIAPACCNPHGRRAVQCEARVEVNTALAVMTMPACILTAENCSDCIMTKIVAVCDVDCPSCVEAGVVRLSARLLWDMVLLAGNHTRVTYPTRYPVPYPDGQADKLLPPC
jgi:hypothetical protein